jgi:uncharacterized damage-inducible protein DinB
MPFVIHRKPPYRVYVEEGSGKAMAHVAELPGCFTVGTDASRAAAAIPGEIVRFLEWLKSHREPLVPEAYVARPSMADLFVAEVQREGAPLVAGSRAGLFEFDRAQWDDERVERTLRWLGYSRADLLGKIEGLGEAELRAREVMQGRSLWKTLWHVANAEFGYIMRLDGPLEGVEPVTDAEPGDVRERLEVIRGIFERRVRAWPAGRRGEVVLPTWTERPNEPWTLPKVLRRALEHEREHLVEL